MFAILYNNRIDGNSFTEIKKKASKIANNYFNPIDEMTLYNGLNTLKFYRINKKYPNNTIVRGKWN